MSEFVSRETSKLELPDGRWIRVKNELSYGEQARLNKAMYGRVSQEALAGGEGMGVDIEAMAIEFLVAYLVDWSFKDGEDKSVPVSRDAVSALSAAWADRIQSAIAAHVQEMDRGKATRGGKLRRVERSA